MKPVYASPSTLRSSTITGMPLSKAFFTTAVSGLASFGLMISRSICLVM